MELVDGGARELFAAAIASDSIVVGVSIKERRHAAFGPEEEERRTDRIVELLRAGDLLGALDEVQNIVVYSVRLVDDLDNDHYLYIEHPGA